MIEEKKIYDITIIGGGPVGLFTAFYGGMRQASVKIIESLPQLGGQLTALYPEKFIYDIAGFPKVRAQELVENLKKQMYVFNPKICLKEAVEQVEKQVDGTFKITTNLNTHFCKAIIITAGNGAFQPRKLELEDAIGFEDKNLHYFINDMNQFKDKKVVILGGGDSAVDWALMLEHIAKKVTLIHRRDKFRAHEHSVKQLVSSSVEVKTPYIPSELVGADQITQIILEHNKTKQKEVIDVDDLIVNYGFISSLGPIKEWGLNIERNAIVVDSRQETNIPGIYAAGDICTYGGKVKLIASGFGEGPTAINNAKAYIDPTAKVQPMHSTSLFS
ncbi:NAD(P)/FAD-dependent oxidoreductase [Priestia filamentosa]|uniref:Ferredoxin--NADP reductase n=1 Tax=Priestia filamentosa TaxID=1402861 RepID=A0A1X7EJ98_9BACI|nr:NAD(P)/FAD-dependent oxidoreductase [Priestia filamentosa]AKO93002.1 ferredoxin--NADP(+) reductase [Priestia filamentosa]MDT3763145.1 NAD(P)/FAD-dependent oxidoreductase [Priestia filamentosa]OXS69659.1 ferredoxin--NADP(+) reductase [Priestia filamentosa]RJS63691.1 NAD(P)/FAD-dependent oxidoreductase [Priestia filamentosa]SMF34970.1 thioredoxin reductase (NADPH) [Priestia filamentosa]